MYPKEVYMDGLPKRIKYYRTKKHMTRDEVASALGIRTDNYAKYESGARTPRDDRLIQLAKILGISYSALLDGVENDFIGLLNRHAVSAVLGDVEALESFANDIELSSEASYAVYDLFDGGEHYFAEHDRELYKKYIASPDIAGLTALYDVYKESLASQPYEPDDEDTSGMTPNEMLLKMTTPKPHNALKYAFCTAVTKYLDKHDIETILQEAGEMAGNIEPLQFFAVKVFVPYLALIIDAVELCKNTTIDDFKKAFLFYALTPPENYNESGGEGDY
jgi:transcriptional regulator with XRE-family HTH domain